MNSGARMAGGGRDPRHKTWADYIEQGVAVGRRRMEADWKGLWKYSRPNEGATGQQVADTERALGFPIPEPYRGFLLTANGWHHFSQDISIFSTEDLLGGSLHHAGQAPLRLEGCVEAMAEDGVVASQYFPVAASLTQIDVFLLGRMGTPSAGRVAWIRDDVVAQYRDFLEFYLAMLEFDKIDIVFLSDRYGPKPDDVRHAVLDRKPSSGR